MPLWGMVSANVSGEMGKGGGYEELGPVPFSTGLLAGQADSSTTRTARTIRINQF